MTTAAAIPQEQVEMLFTLWIRGETEERDSISVKKIYIDINDGYLVDGVMFSQIMYWHGTDKKGKPRLSIDRNGHLWLAKSYDEWMEECRVPARNAREAINRMVDRGLIEKFRWHFNGVPTIHIRVIHDKFIELVSKYDPSLIRQKMADKQEPENPIRQKMSNPSDKKRQNQVTEIVNSYNTETTTETTTKEPPTPTTTTDLEGVDQQHEKAAQERGGGIDGNSKVIPINNRDAIFDALAVALFKVDLTDQAQIRGHSGRIVVLKKKLKAMYPELPDKQLAERVLRFPMWYRSQPETKTASLPLGADTFPGHFSKYIKSLKVKPEQQRKVADPKCRYCGGDGVEIDRATNNGKPCRCLHYPQKDGAK